LDDERLVSLKDAAARFGISRSQLQLLARTGKLHAVKVGNSWVTTPAAVAQYLGNPTLRSKDPYKNKRS
jgi:Helix-turn-helix domain